MVDVATMFTSVASALVRTPMLVMTLLVIAAASLLRITYNLICGRG